MPNIKSAEKRVKVNAAKNAQNRMAKTALKTELKRFSAATPENAESALRSAYKKVDQAVAAGLLHKNTAARRKSAIARSVNATKAAQTQG